LVSFKLFKDAELGTDALVRTLKTSNPLRNLFSLITDRFSSGMSPQDTFRWRNMLQTYFGAVFEIFTVMFIKSATTSRKSWTASNIPTS